MADTETAPATVDINDAYFCTHLKEVVSQLLVSGSPSNDPTSSTLFIIDALSMDWICPKSMLISPVRRVQL